MYHHLQAEWMPSVKQLKGTMPQPFKEKYYQLMRS